MDPVSCTQGPQDLHTHLHVHVGCSALSGSHIWPPFPQNLTLSIQVVGSGEAQAGQSSTPLLGSPAAVITNGVSFSGNLHDPRSVYTQPNLCAFIESKTLKLHPLPLGS